MNKKKNRKKSNTADSITRTAHRSAIVRWLTSDDDMSGAYDFLMLKIAAVALPVTLISTSIAGTQMNSSVEPAVYGEEWHEASLTEYADSADMQDITEGELIAEETDDSEDTAGRSENLIRQLADDNNLPRLNTDLASENTDNNPSTGTDGTKDSKLAKVVKWLVTPWYASTTASTEDSTQAGTGDTSEASSTSNKTSTKTGTTIVKVTEEFGVKAKTASTQDVKKMFAAPATGTSAPTVVSSSASRGVVIAPGSSGQCSLDLISLGEVGAVKNFKIDVTVTTDMPDAIRNRLTWRLNGTDCTGGFTDLQSKVANLLEGMTFSGQMKNVDFLANYTIGWEWPFGDDDADKALLTTYGGSMGSINPSVTVTVTAKQVQ